jgi:hypothetical protein
MGKSVFVLHVFLLRSIFMSAAVVDLHVGSDQFSVSSSTSVECLNFFCFVVSVLVLASVRSRAEASAALCFVCAPTRSRPACDLLHLCPSFRLLFSHRFFPLPDRPGARAQSFAHARGRFSLVFSAACVFPRRPCPFRCSGLVRASRWGCCACHRISAHAFSCSLVSNRRRPVFAAVFVLAPVLAPWFSRRVKAQLFVIPVSFSSGAPRSS